MTGGPSWEAWAPPLAPPDDPGLDYADAERIADAWWDSDPHECAAQQWEAYAALLPPELPVSMVSTGAQSVAYGRAIPSGEFGLALSRAAWHRSFTTSGSVPLHLSPDLPPVPVGRVWWTGDAS